jgi:hypothetical protein
MTSHELGFNLVDIIAAVVATELGWQDAPRSVASAARSLAGVPREIRRRSEEGSPAFQGRFAGSFRRKRERERWDRGET